MLDEKSAKHVSTAPLSNETVSRRIHDLASYVKQELVTRLQKARFVLQIDESTDVTGLAILLVIATSPSHRKAIEGLPTIEHTWQVLQVINLIMQCQLDSSWWARNANCLLEPRPKFRMFYWQCKASSSLDEKTAKIKPLGNQSMYRSKHHTPSRCSCRLHKVVQVTVYR
ncbi:zinc finger BED domain-containing protein 5 [Trichonephila clavipes]|nr:zinc finger BED domain-containing protein 5 [Trichonephila clavipes]